MGGYLSIENRIRARSDNVTFGSQRYVSTICLAIFSGDIPWNLGLKNRPYIWNRYLQWIGSWNGHWHFFSKLGPVSRSMFGGMVDYRLELLGGFEPPLWRIRVRQLGWWNSQYMESHKSHVPNHQPEKPKHTPRVISTSYSTLSSSTKSWNRGFSQTLDPVNPDVGRKRQINNLLLVKIEGPVWYSTCCQRGLSKPLY